MLTHNMRMKSEVSSLLGVQGWQHLDSIFLAALTSEAPVLLVGPHGTAKSLLVERISAVLGLEFRHYNASLLNYDDLVGIPLPEENNTRLQFVSTPGAIWQAEFVFFDEISRCRPDLQNKLFPIIHERKVVGMPLERLRHRWAAMNPPAPNDADLNSVGVEYYLGSEALDPALVDRFPFIVPVPNWGQLSKEDRRRVIAFDSSDGPADDGYLLAMVRQCADLIPEVEADCGDWLTDYMMCVMDLLEQAKLSQSPRRARMLARSAAAVHAARIVLEGEEADLAESAELALLYGLPQTATEVPPAESKVVAVHRQAWEIAALMENDSWRTILEEPDLIERVALGIRMDVEAEEMTRLVTQALSADPSEPRKVGLATAMFLHFRRHNRLTPAAWEFLVKLAVRVLEPRAKWLIVAPNSPDMNMWNDIKSWAEQHRDSGELGSLEANYILSGFPEFWRTNNWRDALDQFRKDLEMFNIKDMSI